jgi:hypothetical protein
MQEFAILVCTRVYYKDTIATLMINIDRHVLSTIAVALYNARATAPLSHINMHA